LLMATAITPGLLDSWSITARLNAPTDAVVGYCVSFLYDSILWCRDVQPYWFP
jgi:hypothetical protein